MISDGSVRAQSGQRPKLPRFRVERLLSLGAGPSFAVMALLAAVQDGSNNTMCSGAYDGSPLTGMIAMYVLMSVLHAAPWLRVIRRRQGLPE